MGKEGWLLSLKEQTLVSREGWGTEQHLIFLSWPEASDKVAAHLRFLQMLCGGKEPAQLARPYLCFLEAEWEFSNAEV